MTLDPEQEITWATLHAIKSALGLRQEVPPRLIYRACEWAAQTIVDLQDKIDRVKEAVEE